MKKILLNFCLRNLEGKGMNKSRKLCAEGLGRGMACSYQVQRSSCENNDRRQKGNIVIELNSQKKLLKRRGVNKKEALTLSTRFVCVPRTQKIHLQYEGRQDPCIWTTSEWKKLTAGDNTKHLISRKLI